MSDALIKVTPTTSGMWLARVKKDMEHAPNVRVLAAMKDNVKPRLTKADTERLRIAYEARKAQIRALNQ